jgi:AGZA family xanthine/uracil permease-like MFS transporter
MMPFTFSITAGIGIGFVTYVVLKAARGKLREIHPLMYAVTAAFGIYFLQGLIASAIS